MSREQWFIDTEEMFTFALKSVATGTLNEVFSDFKKYNAHLLKTEQHALLLENYRIMIDYDKREEAYFFEKQNRMFPVDYIVHRRRVWLDELSKYLSLAVSLCSEADIHAAKTAIAEIESVSPNAYVEKLNLQKQCEVIGLPLEEISLDASIFLGSSSEFAVFNHFKGLGKYVSCCENSAIQILLLSYTYETMKKYNPSNNIKNMYVFGPRPTPNFDILKYPNPIFEFDRELAFQELREEMLSVDRITFSNNFKSVLGMKIFSDCSKLFLTRF